MKIKYLIVLVSGGRSSAMMARHIQTSRIYDGYEILYVFCNSGQERPETIQFLKDMIYYWDLQLHITEGVYSQVPGIGVKSKLVDFDTMDMKGNVYSQAIQQMNKYEWKGVPNQAIPYCSDYIKTRPAHHFAKQIFKTTKYIKALGYRKEDMPKRITMAELRSDSSKIAPLITDFAQPIGKYDLTHYFKKQPFQLSIPSDLGNCELCWKKSERNLIKVIQYGTRFIDWHDQHEKLYNNKFFRNNLSIHDLVKMAESGTQLELFENHFDDKCVCNF